MSEEKEGPAHAVPPPSLVQTPEQRSLRGVRRTVFPGTADRALSRHETTQTQNRCQTVVTEVPV